MRIPNNGVVLVADGRKSLFFRNEGDADFPNLVVEDKTERREDYLERTTDSPGRAFTAAGTPRSGGVLRPGANNRSAYEEADPRQVAEDRFAAELAEMLRTRVLDGDFDALVVVAPAGTLDELRRHYHVEVVKRLVGEVTKDLTGMPVTEIEKVLQAS